MFKIPKLYYVPQPTVNVSAALIMHAVLKRVMQRFDRKLGGGAGLKGMDGSFRFKGFTRIMGMCWKMAGDHCSVVDIGSGLGRLLLMAYWLNPKELQDSYEATEKVYGIEFDEEKLKKSYKFGEKCREAALLAGGERLFKRVDLPTLIHEDVTNITSLEPATHVYTAWEGMGAALMQHIVELIRRSRTAYVAIFCQHGAHTTMANHMEGYGGLGNGWRAAGRVPVHMSGSGEQLQAFFYIKDPALAQYLPHGYLDELTVFTPDYVPKYESKEPEQLKPKVMQVESTANTANCQ